MVIDFCNQNDKNRQPQGGRPRGLGEGVSMSTIHLHMLRLLLITIHKLTLKSECLQESNKIGKKRQKCENSKLLKL